ncbi:type VI secretion system protein TssA [Phaeobacter sp. HF9A]|uniref:type VI secretion system protein TssA n=1 Tax=Phaeobacter sp. HF9A TaxID=2721561 RepID=UPI001431D002|nr:type VI secretion system protein TssA [Phaeobacter sp. HF9A]NIZ15733.1 type VI secretion system protein TssA [Phaeobacter sp. HF9A]
MDVTILLQSKGGDKPSGSDPGYDPDFKEMELAAKPTEEVVLGDQVTPGKDPDYREVESKALAVLERAHDLRAAVFLSDAILYSAGVTGFAEVTTLMRGMLEEFWDSCHPVLDEDDGDPTERINAVQDICGQPDGMGGPSPAYRSLRRAPLTESRGFGRFSMRDIEIAEGILPAPEGMDHIPDTSTVGAAFQDSDESVLAERLAALETIESNIRAISAVFDEQTPGQGPELDPLLKLLRQMAQKMRSYGSMGEETADAAAESEATGEEQTPVAGAPSNRASGPAGAINSPTDVANTIDRIIAYYRREEPSSPVPLLLERAKRLVGADFLTIINDMAPRGLENVQLVGGLEEDDD